MRTLIFDSHLPDRGGLIDGDTICIELNPVDQVCRLSSYVDVIGVVNTLLVARCRPPKLRIG